MVEDLPINGVKLITPFYVEDNRGYFLKYYEQEIYKRLGIEGETREDFETFSERGVIRGLHFQTINPQQKIVHVPFGTIHDVIVDLRTGSETFGEHLDIELSGENHRVLYIPSGFAHGFEVLSECALTSYKCIGEYIVGADTGIYFNSPKLNIEWQTEEPVLSEKDKRLMMFEEFITKYGGLS